MFLYNLHKNSYEADATIMHILQMGWGGCKKRNNLSKVTQSVNAEAEIGSQESGFWACTLNQYTMLPIFQVLFFMKTNWICSMQCLKHDLFTLK